MSLQSKAFSHPCRRRSVPRRPLRAAPPPSPASDLFPHPKGEIRRYSFPALAIRCERELLEVQQAEDMKEILSNVSASVDAFASLMELMDLMLRLAMRISYADETTAKKYVLQALKHEVGTAPV